MKKGGGVKGFLHKFFKVFIIFMLITLAVNLLIFGLLYANHVSKSNDEEVYMNEPGTLVEVNGHYIHVLEAGNTESDEILVFMHSDSVVDDSMALQPLFEELQEYHLVLVERSGYGYSESSGVSKDIETMLSETREALLNAGIEGPYNLVPQGTAGVEAIYWADMYPEEVSSIIGINMNYPKQFEVITSEAYAGFFDYLMVKFCGIGGFRVLSNSSIYPENTYGLYTEIQMKTRNALISQRGYTDDMFAEQEAMVDNAAEVAELGWPEDTEMLMLIANPIMEPYLSTDETISETYESAKEENPDFDYETAYNETTREYYAQFENVETIEMAGPSRLYTYDPEGVAEYIINFLAN